MPRLCLWPVVSCYCQVAGGVSKSWTMIARCVATAYFKRTYVVYASTSGPAQNTLSNFGCSLLTKTASALVKQP
jgi:hypothetical protein